MGLALEELLFPSAAMSPHQNEACPDPDQEPGAEVAQQDAKSDSDKAAADKRGTAVRVPRLDDLLDRVTPSPPLSLRSPAHSSSSD